MYVALAHGGCQENAYRLSADPQCPHKATRTLSEWVSSGGRSFFPLFSRRSIGYLPCPPPRPERVLLSNVSVPHRRLCTPHTVTTERRPKLQTSSSYLLNIHIDVPPTEVIRCAVLS